MYDISTLFRDRFSNRFYVFDWDGDEECEITEKFPSELWDCPEAFKMAGIRGYEPMTAKELETTEIQDERLADSSNFIEEKFDGTRALIYFMAQTCVDEENNPTHDVGFVRVFSRRISKKTGFYVENSDSLPHIRDLDVPELAGTILDGEMFIDGLPFKEVASTLNCLWDKAVDRQIEKGFITFHAFDILFYKGVDLRNMPLVRRKVYLKYAVEEAGCRYITEVESFVCGKYLDTCVEAELLKRIPESTVDAYYDMIEDKKMVYPNLYSCIKEDANHKLTPRGYYELIVSLGGEGLIVKPQKGKYRHKRGWEYSKIKSFLTRELVVIGFDEPTKEYTGKDEKRWGFWIELETGKRVIGNFYGDKRYEPVTKFYYYGQVGNLILGVMISKEDYDKIPKNKRGEIHSVEDNGRLLMEVCECAGFDDEQREYFTKNRDKVEGCVVEVIANGIFKDSGRMRHPRYMRMRFDKNPESCTWEEHIGD